MTDAEKLVFVKTLINDSTVTNDVINTYLTLAKQKILDRCYPFGTGGTTMPSKYDLLHCELTSRYILRRGAEGQTVSIENGIHRHYGSVNDEDLLSEVMQIVSVV